MESLQEHPQQPGKILIGYSRGLVVLWDLAARHAEQLFLGKQVGPAESAHLFFVVWTVTIQFLERTVSDGLSQNRRAARINQQFIDVKIDASINS